MALFQEYVKVKKENGTVVAVEAKYGFCRVRRNTGVVINLGAGELPEDKTLNGLDPVLNALAEAHYAEYLAPPEITEEYLSQEEIDVAQ